MRPRMDYVALRTIQVGGVAGYREGDEMVADVVDNLGLEVGVDVLPLRPDVIPRPAGDAPRGDWAAYAMGQGMDREEVDDLSRDELRGRFPDGDAASDVMQVSFPDGVGPAEVLEDPPQGIGDEVPDGTVDEVLDWVGDDKTRAVMALHVERDRDRPRVGVVEPLERLVGE
jgi:hypothetical protein